MTLRIPGTRIEVNGKGRISLLAIALGLLTYFGGHLAAYALAQMEAVPGLVTWRHEHTEFAKNNIEAINRGLDAGTEDRRVIREALKTKDENDREWRAELRAINQQLLDGLGSITNQLHDVRDRLPAKPP